MVSLGGAVSALIVTFCLLFSDIAGVFSTITGISFWLGGADRSFSTTGEAGDAFHNLHSADARPDRVFENEVRNTQRL